MTPADRLRLLSRIDTEGLFPDRHLWDIAEGVDDLTDQELEAAYVTMEKLVVAYTEMHAALGVALAKRGRVQ